MMKRKVTMEDVSNLAKRFEGNDVLIRITPEGTNRVFSVQKAMLCNASDYFTKALGSGFHEQTTNTLTLPGCDVDTLEIFLHWLCTRELPDSVYLAKQHDPGSAERDAVYRRQQTLLVKVWVFADAYLLRELQNQAIQDLHRLLGLSYTHVEALGVAFTLASEGSQIRNILIEEAAHGYGRRDICGDPVYTDADLDALGAVPGVMAAMLKAMCACSGSCSDPWFLCERGADGSDIVGERHLVAE